APTPLALAAAGVAFCYMTQLSRYVEYRKHKVHGIRVVQKNRFSVTGGAQDYSLRGGVAPFETHVFLNADEPDEVMQNLLEIAENTCYLHAALRSKLLGRAEVALNGAAVSA
ncbi:MAG: OsmC family protein, partial [Burkholderiales bacterium]